MERKMTDLGMTGAQITDRNAKLAALTAAQISSIFSYAGMGAAAQRHGNVYNQLRCGQINEVVGTLKSGCSGRSIKDARRLLRKALRAEGIEI